ncbi:MAG: flagellar hook-basal body complex protein FliE [Acidobacteria bacterium]|nr:flagellar hook-basal body complex protein FliE [Acidobacteriota bacterium]
MMIPAIPPIPSISTSIALGIAQTPGVGAAGAASGVGAVNAAGSGSFQNILGQAIDALNGTTNNATNVSLQAAAGTASVADATIATTEADLATQLASGVTSKAVTALNSIMNMPM